MIDIGRVLRDVKWVVENGPRNGNVAPFVIENVARWLYYFGHTRNSAYPGAYELGESDLGKLDHGDNEFRSMVKSIQSLDANFNELCKKHHGRTGNVDGELGPATLELLTIPRCGKPDYYAEESDAPSVQSSANNWRLPGCDPEDPERATVRSVRFYIDYSRNPHSDEYTKSFVQQAQLCMAEMGLRSREVTNRAEAEYTISWERLSGSTIGWYYVLNGRACAVDYLDGRLSTSYTPNDPYMFALLFIHEMWGHGIGHGHSNGGIMNPSIYRTPSSTTDGVTHPTWKGDPYESRMISWMGGEPVSLTPETDPETEPKPPPDGELEERVASLEQTVARLERDLEEQETEIDELQTENRQQSEALAQLDQRVRALEADGTPSADHAARQ